MTDNTVNLTLTIDHKYSGQRLDQTLATLIPEYSRTRLQQWIKSKQVLVNNSVAKPRDKIKGGEFIKIHAIIQAQEKWQAQPIDLDVVYADKDIIIINKAANFVVHPGAGNPDQTLVNALLHHFPELHQLPRAGLVHRLDKDTTGLLMVARSSKAHQSLTQQLEKRQIERQYIALVYGNIIAGGTINKPIGRHPHKRTHMAVISDGKPAVTHFSVLQRFRAHTLLQIKLETGRTHQIRVHMAVQRHAVVGDPIYAQRMLIPRGASDTLIQALQNFKRQALHAHKLSLQHPSSAKNMCWTAAIPSDMQILIDLLIADQEQYHGNH